MKKIVGITFIIGLFIPIALANAAILPCGWDKNGDGEITINEECTFCHIWELISNVVNFVVWRLAVAVAPILFVVAGVLYIISAGNPNKLARAKTIFFNTIIGLVIIFCAWLIVDTILKTIGGGSFENIVPAWNEFPSCAPPGP